MPIDFVVIIMQHAVMLMFYDHMKLQSIEISSTSNWPAPCESVHLKYEALAVNPVHHTHQWGNSFFRSGVNQKEEEE